MQIDKLIKKVFKRSLSGQNLPLFKFSKKTRAIKSTFPWNDSLTKDKYQLAKSILEFFYQFFLFLLRLKLHISHIQFGCTYLLVLEML